MKDERLIVLLDAFLDATLSAEEKQELERMLLESDAARREFWERASLHGWTYAAAKLTYGAKPAEEVARERRGLRGAPFEAFESWLRRASRLGWKMIFAGAAGTAAVVLWLGIRALQPVPLDEDDGVADLTPLPTVRTNYIATLTRGTGVVWDGESNNIEIGSALAAGWLHLKSGAVQVEFNSGARVILEGPASLELVSAREARLDFGKLSARVPEPAHGFKVYTSDLTMTDLGTEFGLNRPANQPMKVEVFEGKVEVAKNGAVQPVQVLNAGQGVQVNAQQMQPMSAVDPREFLSVQDLAFRESEELRTRYADWRESDAELNYDPAVLVHLNFEDQSDAERNLINRAIGTRASSRAMILGCDWGEGRWPGKGALEFNGLNDRVRLSVPGVFDSLTYLAWLRVDGLPNQRNGLALVNTFKAGQVHWQIRRSGSLEMAVRVEGGKTAWDHLVSPPVVTRENFGKWIQLAAVFDGSRGRMVLYLNGREVASKASKILPLTLGTLELGNWTPAARNTSADYRIRDFHGRMDEFTLLGRAMSPEEIRRQYELGKPRDTTAVAGLKRF
ncbi:MAG TPA: LamG-like jellyroll fold domain-containing protein [Verrucomicrobiae bacterium]|jgi:ferric-dicitrate binding protein FerR (iron transport regulator)|nr:LamG-like jellyroll fold domain-containing protein [Verrucomicrobiae bacterium]